MTIPARTTSHDEQMHDHDHGGEGHHHRPAGAGGKRGLLIAFSITLLMMVVEIVGGILANSLALLSDAGHMFTDALALGLSYFAMRFAEMPATERRTYGFYRLEILAALFNGVTLALMSVYILYEAYHRLLNPPKVEGPLMLVVAVIGLIANIIGALFLRSHHEENLNIRSAFLHIVGDAVSSVGVIIGGIIIIASGWYPIDPLLSMLITVGIIIGAWGLVKESVSILLESAPPHVDITAVTEDIGRIKGVREAYHIHVWTITSGVYALSAHVIVDDQPVSGSRQILNEIRALLANKYKVAHSTIQLECERCDDSPFCSLPGKEDRGS